MLEVKGLSKSFGGFKAVSDVDLAVAEGEIAAVIGPNGAGKSTLFNLITGHLQPTAGRVIVDGRDITGVAPHKLCSMGMGRSFQRTNIFPKLTVLENVQAAFLIHRGQGPNFWSRSERLYRADSETLLASIGLADAVSPEQADAFALVDLERDAEQHTAQAIGRMHVLELQVGAHDHALISGLPGRRAGPRHWRVPPAVRRGR